MESQFFKPPRETKISSKKWLVCEIRGKIGVWLRGGKQILVTLSWGLEYQGLNNSGFHCKWDVFYLAERSKREKKTHYAGFDNSTASSNFSAWNRFLLPWHLLHSQIPIWSRNSERGTAISNFFHVIVFTYFLICLFVSPVLSKWKSNKRQMMSSERWHRGWPHSILQKSVVIKFQFMYPKNT